MTGCDLCGVGPDDECSDECPSRALPTTLRQAEVRYQRAFRRSEAEREARNAVVQTAIQAGWTHARIAEATGLTRSRVGQIAKP